MGDFVDIGGVTRVPAEPPDRPPQDSNDGYPDVIRDQRNTYAGLSANTVEKVVAHWDWFLAKKGQDRVPDDRPVVPYINQSRWAADCPQCNAGMSCWDRNPYTCCLGCGRQYKVRWQDPWLRSAVIRTIAARPENERCWDPRPVDKQGKSVQDIGFLERINLLTFGIGGQEANGLILPDTIKPPDNLESER